jgi:hypothetical protein
MQNQDKLDKLIEAEIVSYLVHSFPTCHDKLDELIPPNNEQICSQKRKAEPTPKSTKPFLSIVHPRNWTLSVRNWRERSYILVAEFYSPVGWYL